MFMSFYKEIVHRLFVWNTRIGETEFEPFEYIEEKHKEAPYKGRVFYTILMRELPNHFGAKLRNDFYLELLNYCNQKIREVADTVYFLPTFIDGQAQKQSLYIAYKGTVESKGFVSVKQEAQTFKVYTPELAFILSSKELPAFNKDLEKETTINGWEYLQTYADAYKEGQAYFDAEFKVSPDTLYGANASQYVKDIHINYFHNKYKGGHEGWAFVKRVFPFLITHKEISEFGYFSGIVSRVEEQIKKYPRLFATFDKCEHNLEPQQTETKTEQETPITFEELFYDINFVSPCIDILKEVEPPLIDTDFNYIGKLKGAFCVWIDEMQRQGIVKRYSDRKIFASLIPQKIKRFSIDESMFGKYQSKAESQYRTDMKTLLSQIKLSLNSQKGKLGK